MALSTYFNWNTLQTPISEICTTNFHEATPELLAQDHYHHHLFPYSDESFFLRNTFVDPYFDDPYFEPNGFLHPEIYPSQLLLPNCTSSYDPFISLNDIFQTEGCNNTLLPCPKRQKCFHEEQEIEHSQLQELAPPNFLDGFVPNPCSILPPSEELPEEVLFSAVPEFTVPELPQGACVGNANDVQCEKKGSERTISAQSIAARERRRKITEKTQELGKLVPGGPKMNTAEMLHAASKYVKYLQAQVGMLELMNTLKVTVLILATLLVMGNK